MSSDENSSANAIVGQKRQGSPQPGPRKKSATDPLVHHGRHFGRTVHALCTVRTLLNNGIIRMRNLTQKPENTFSQEEKREYRVFQQLLEMVPGLKKRLMEGSSEDIIQIAELIQKGASSARSDDTKSLKGAVLDWITPEGQPLSPPLARNVKTDRGFHHDRTGALLCPAGLDWSDTETKEKLRNGELAEWGAQLPIFLYQEYSYNPEDPWKGLFRSSLLVNAYKHLFTSPSSVSKEPTAARSGNARIHGMTQVTLPSIAYVATQVRFALSSLPVFSRADTVTDSEGFYNNVMNLFDDEEEKEEVNDLVTWWNCQIFPNHSNLESKNTVVARIKAKRLELMSLARSDTTAGSDNTSTNPSFDMD